MAFKKLNLIQKFLLKAKSSEAYKNYKFFSALQGVEHPRIDLDFKTEIHFLHSGHSGDIIYSVPAMNALANGRKIHLHLQVNKKTKSYGKKPHHLGTVMLNEKMVSMLQPLLLTQASIETCDVYHQQPVDIDLTWFRRYPFNYRGNHIARWYFHAFGVSGNLGLPWLQAPKDNSYSNAIIIARSQRYQQPGISYNFLTGYGQCLFVGLEDEFAAMKKIIPTIEYHPVRDFLELATVINSGRFFIGNQSLPFAIAEGLKTKRLLEVFHLSPNVIVEGTNGYDFCYQPQFEKLVAQLHAASQEQSNTDL